MTRGALDDRETRQDFVQESPTPSATQPKRSRQGDSVNAVPNDRRDSNLLTPSESNSTPTKSDRVAKGKSATTNSKLSEQFASEAEVEAWEKANLRGTRKTPFGRPPEAAPLMLLIEGIREKDRDKFLSAFGTTRQQKGDDNMDRFAQNYVELYGADWNSSDFEFSFFGTSEKGTVATSFLGQMLRGQAFVANVGGRWILVGIQP